MLNFQLLRFYLLKVERYFKEYRNSVIERIFLRFVSNKKSIIDLLNHANYALRKRKQSMLNESHGKKSKVIFFVFRDCQMLDWFIPIHRSLNELYPDTFTVLYVNFGSTLPRVGINQNYIPYLVSIEKRLSKASIPNYLHFSDREIPYYQKFPIPDLILSSEVIRKEKFKCTERVYLPHYSVTKVTKRLKIMNHFNYLFLPSKKHYTYQDLTEDDPRYSCFPVGYPKIEFKSDDHQKRFDNNKPTIIYAPNLDPAIVLRALKKGILKAFNQMTDYNFLVKTHPTLANKTFNLFRLINEEVKSKGNIKIDTNSNIEDVGYYSTMMITDFGSVGAEYKLRFGKRLIYLNVPKNYEGGGDLVFRDHFADAITDVKDLPAHIDRLLELGDLSETESNRMRSSVLYNFGSSDRIAAQTIHSILLPEQTD